MKRSEVVLLAVAAALAGAVLWLRHDLLEEQLARHNAEAAADSSRLVLVDAVHRVSERLAFQQTSNIQLRGDLARLLHVNGQQTQMLAQFRIELDSIAGARSSGTVTAAAADSTIRELAASIDTAGFRVRVRALVPPPPRSASVFWDVHRDNVEVVAALNRDQDGRLALRLAADRYATPRIDTVRVRINSGLQRTQALAGAGAIALLFFVLGKIL